VTHFGVAVGGQAEPPWAFISAICSGTPARITASLFSSTVGSR
jgi:hypothetical protein